MMSRGRAVFLLVGLSLTACAEPNGTGTDAGSDGAMTDDAPVDASVDGGGFLDGDVTDATPDAHAVDAGDGVDAGTDDGGTDPPDAGASDTGDTADAYVELEPDSGHVDAGAGDASIEPDAGVIDAGVDAGTPPPAAPVGGAVDVSDGGCLTDRVRGAPYTSCATCALDSAGHFWCWGRWGSAAAGETVRYFGSGFVGVGGTCAVRADGTVACAEIVAGTIADVPGLVLDRIAEGSGYYDDTSFGRGRHVCGFRGTSVHCFHEYSGAGGTPPMAGTITSPSCGGASCIDYAVSGPADGGVAAPYDGFDAIGICRSQVGMPTQCRFGLSGAYSLSRAPGTNHDVGRALDCAIDAGRLGCYSQTDSFRSHDLPGFVDYAITWVSAHDAPGVCAAYVDPSRGDHIRCFTDNGTLVRFADVNW